MPKRILEGVVVSDKGDKTIVVKVDRTVLHPVLKKTMRRSKKYHAHDETNAYKAGEIARIVECAPKSKLKTWEALPKAEAARTPEPKAKASRAKKAAPAAAPEEGAAA
jgi:small subunit ribosomal protein S17